MTVTPISAASDRRRAARPDAPERRRGEWREFRHAYPAFVRAIALGLALLLAIDAFLVVQRVRYDRETARLRASMSDVERRRMDAVLAASEDHLRLMVELMRRQALGDAHLHLAVAVDSGRMVLERDGARLRDMRVDVGPERWVGEPPDTVRAAAPRGTRTVERILGPQDAWEVPRWVWRDRGLAIPAERSIVGALGPRAILLSGGTVIYAPAVVGPLNDSAYVMPGAVRVSAADLEAIAANVSPGMTVYFY